MGSFPTSVAQRLLKQLFISPTSFAHGTANIPLYNSSTTASSSSGITATGGTAGAVNLYVGLLWHFSPNAGGPGVTGGFPGGNGFATGLGINDDHIKAVGNWGATTATDNWTLAGLPVTLTSNAAGTPAYPGRLAELTNGGYTGRAVLAGGNGLTRQRIGFVTGATSWDDTASATSPSVTSNNAAGGSVPTTNAIAFGTYSGTAQGATFDGASMTAAFCSIVGFFITPLAGGAISGSWGQGTNAATAAGAVDAFRPWIIAYGQLSNSRSVNVGDQPQFTYNAITITLA